MEADEYKKQFGSESRGRSSVQRVAGFGEKADQRRVAARGVGAELQEEVRTCFVLDPPN